MNKWIPFLAAVAAFLPVPAMAQSVGNVFAPERIGRWYLSGAIGGYGEEDNSQLGNHDGKFGFAVSGGYRVTPNIALEADALFSYQDFNTPATIPAPFVGTGRADLYTNGVGGLVKLILPLGRVELYAGGGVGLYTTTLHVEGTISGVDAKIEEKDTDIGYQALAGADFFVSRRISLGLEYRMFNHEAAFSGVIPGKLDMGGDFFFATVRGHF